MDNDDFKTALTIAAGFLTVLGAIIKVGEAASDLAKEVEDKL